MYFVILVFVEILLDKRKNKQNKNKQPPDKLPIFNSNPPYSPVTIKPPNK